MGRKLPRNHCFGAKHRHGWKPFLNRGSQVRILPGAPPGAAGQPSGLPFNPDKHMQSGRVLAD